MTRRGGIVVAQCVRSSLHGAQAGEEAGQLLLGEVFQKRAQAGASHLLHFAEDVLTGVGEPHQHRPMIRLAMMALEQAVLFHAGTDALARVPAGQFFQQFLRQGRSVSSRPGVLLGMIGREAAIAAVAR